MRNELCRALRVVQNPPAGTPRVQGNADAAARAAAATVRFPWQNASLPVDERVEMLLARLTPKQKIAQLQSRPGNGIPELGVPAFDWQVGVWEQQAHCHTPLYFFHDPV